MPITIDSRGVSVYITDDEARAQAAALASRAEQALDAADARGWSLNDSDAARVAFDLQAAHQLLVDVGDVKTSSAEVSDLKRFTEPGESEAVLAARAAADERRRALVRRMAETALMVDELGEDDIVHDANNIPKIGENSAVAENSPPERVNIKRVEDSAGVLWLVTGKGEAKRFATLEVAEREARRRAMGRA